MTPFLMKIRRKFPGLYWFLARRFELRRFSGMPLTLLVLAVTSNFLMMLDVYEDILNTKEFVAVDDSVARFLYGIRIDLVARFFYLVTQLGNQYFILASIITVSIVFITRKKTYYVWGLLVSVAGSSLTVLLGKHIFKIGRPLQFAYYHMDSYSFPSGHSTAAIAFYGLMFYLLIRNAKKIKSKFALLATGFILILTIGFSRMYLCEHFLSDVVGGYLLGFLWLLLSISVILWEEDRMRRIKPR